MKRVRTRLWRTVGVLALLATLAGCSAVQQVAGQLETSVTESRSAVRFGLEVLRLVDSDRITRAAALVSCSDAAEQASSAEHDVSGTSIADQPSRELRDRVLAGLHEASGAALGAQDDLRLGTVSPATLDRLRAAAATLSRLDTELKDLQ